MKISAQGVMEIAEHEGLVLGPYKDSVGVWTYGVGHTKAAGGLDPSKMAKVDTRQWSDAQVQKEIRRALALFDNDLDSYERRVDEAITVPLKQHQFDALVSFDFNTGGIFRAQLTRDINAGRMDGNGFMGWVRPKEIIKRRKAEQALFRTGNYAANGESIPIYDALPDGRYRFRFAMKSSQLVLPERSSSPVLVPAPAPKSNSFGDWVMSLFRN